jgi:hypothetical protein
MMSQYIISLILPYGLLKSGMFTKKKFVPLCFPSMQIQFCFLLLQGTLLSSNKFSKHTSLSFQNHVVKNDACCHDINNMFIMVMHIFKSYS